MAALNADDLPPDMRKRLGLPAKARRTKDRSEVTGHLHVRCHDCLLEFHHITGPDGYETHSDATRHRIFDCVYHQAEIPR